MKWGSMENINLYLKDEVLLEHYKAQAENIVTTPGYKIFN
jgi:hypothetical protein